MDNTNDFNSIEKPITILSNGAALYPSQVDALIDQACAYLEIDNLKEEKQGPWKACLTLVGQVLFETRDKLRDTKHVYMDNSGHIMTYKAYDVDILKALCNYYIILCQRYNKLVSDGTFEKFLNMPEATVTNWSSNGSPEIQPTIKDINNRIEGIQEDTEQYTELQDNNINNNIYNNNSVPNNNYIKYISKNGSIKYLVDNSYRRYAKQQLNSIYILLHKERENCLKDKCFDSNNVLGAISIGNQENGWNMPGVSRQATSNNAISTTELPRFGLEMSNNLQGLPDNNT